MNVVKHNSLRKDLAVWWKLDEASGNRVPAFCSQSPAGLTLIDGNTVTSAASRNPNTNAARFTAANFETLTTPDAPAISLTDQDFTIAVWCSVSDKSIDRRVYHKGRGLAPNEFAYALRYRQLNDGFRFALSNGSTAGGLNSVETITSNTWYLVVCYHDSVNNLIGISVNGNAPTTAAWTVGCFDDADSLILGHDTAGTYYDGSIGDLMIWKRVLTTAEISSLYNGGSGRYPIV